MVKKAFFFLRHNNDIDHIVPVLHKWLSKEKIETHVIVSYNKDLLNDYRIKYLKKFKNARIYYISSLLEKFAGSKILYKTLYNFFYSLYKFHKSWILKKFLFENKLLEIFDKKVFCDIDQGLVVFDWTQNDFNLKIAKIANKHGFVTVSLPHGDEPAINRMIYKDDLYINFNPDTYEKFVDYDYVVVPNLLVKRRYKSINESKLKVLGSARYSDEWMNFLPKIRPKHNLDYGKEKVKILMFLRPPTFPIYWEELSRTIKLISQFPNTYLIVDHHPRGGGALKQLKETRKLPNVKHVIKEIPSENLMDWADLIIDVGGTSAVWDPIKRKKPVIMLEYLHANYNTVSLYIKESEIKNRDQFYYFLKDFVKNKNINFYNSGGREKFIKELIDVPNKRVLENYHEFLKKCFEESKNKKIR